MRRLAALTALVAVTVGATGCTSKSQSSARREASGACGVLLFDVGGAIATHRSVSSGQARAALTAAATDARRAANLDHAHWAVFSGLVAAIAADLEHGNRGPLPAHLEALGQDCKGLEVKGSVATTTVP